MVGMHVSLFAMWFRGLKLHVVAVKGIGLDREKRKKEEKRDMVMYFFIWFQRCLYIKGCVFWVLNLVIPPSHLWQNKPPKLSLEHFLANDCRWGGQLVAAMSFPDVFRTDRPCMTPFSHHLPSLFHNFTHVHLGEARNNKRHGLTTLLVDYLAYKLPKPSTVSYCPSWFGPHGICCLTLFTLVRFSADRR